MKKGRIIAVIACMSLFTIGCANTADKKAGHATNATTQPTKESFLNEPMIQPTPRVDLKAEDIEKLNILNQEVNPTKDIISNADGFSDQYEDFREMIDSTITDPEQTIDNFSLAGVKEYYISRFPIRYWNAMENEVSTNIETVLLLSKDMKTIGQYDFMFRDGEVAGNEVGTAEDVFGEVLRKKKDSLFIPVFNDGTTLLSANNEMTKGMGNVKINVEGDYYSILRSKGLGISWNLLTDKDNLKLVKVNDWR